MNTPTPEQIIADLRQQIGAWEQVATKALAGRIEAQRQLVASVEREKATAETVRSLQARVTEMSELVATTVGHVEQVTEKAKQATAKQIEANTQEGWRGKFEATQTLLAQERERTTKLQTYIKTIGVDREEAIQRGAAVMRETIARHVQTHPNKTLGSEIANHIRHGVPLPTIDDVVRHFTPQPADA